MSFVEVRDHVLWVDDIHGNKALQDQILAMKQGELIELKVNGVRGMWERIAAPGIKALAGSRSEWHELRSERHGGITTVETCDLSHAD